MFVSAGEDDMRDSRPRTWAAVGTLFVEAPYGRNVERKEGSGLFPGDMKLAEVQVGARAQRVPEELLHRGSIPHHRGTRVLENEGDTMSHAVSDDRHRPVEELVPVVDFVLIFIR